MSSTHNLNELAGQDYFSMDLDGYIYRMSYPSAKDIIELDALSDGFGKENARLEEITELMLSEEDEHKRIELTQEAEKIKTVLSEDKTTMLDWCVRYIQPEDTKAPDFKETLIKKNIKYLMAFMKILKDELK